MSDLIKREDAIKAVENNSYGMGSRASVKAIKALPSADAEWIPVSERLPTKRRSVLITTSEDFVGEACYWATTENHVIWKGYRWETTYWDDEVVAWMPLPTPYKGGAE